MINDTPTMSPEDVAKGFVFETWTYLGVRVERVKGCNALAHKWLRPDESTDTWPAEARKERSPFGLSLGVGSQVRIMVRRDDDKVYVRTSGENAPAFIRRDHDDPRIVEWTALHRAALREREQQKLHERDAERDAFREALAPLRAAYWQLRTPWQRGAFITDVVGYIMGGADPSKKESE